VLSWFAQEDTDRYMPLVEALRALGRVDGRDIAFEYRWADGDATRAAQFAADLVRGRVDVLVALASPAAEAARQATQSIPIVFAVADPLDIGLVDNLARPGGNLTGVSMVATDVAAKWLEFLREIVPGLARVAFLGSTRTPTTPDILRRVQATAAQFSVVVLPMLVGDPGEIDAAFAATVAARIGAVIVQPILVSSRAAIGAQGLRHRLPWIGDSPEFAEAGALISYGANRAALLRRAANQVARILRGAAPGDLPIEQPTTFQLVVNLRSARALGLAVPESVLAQADRVVE
jgi:putative ABC transport system substrate-binding protein